MALKKALLAATMLALPVVAQAQPVSGLYLGAGVGMNMLMETDARFTGSDLMDAEGVSGKIDFDPGFVGVISLGYGFGNGVRAEIEGSFRENNASSVSGFDGPDSVLGASGRTRSYGVMANAL
jgi:hypothetical protein